MRTALQTKESVKSGLNNSGQIYEKTQRYATYLTGTYFTSYSTVQHSPHNICSKYSIFVNMGGSKISMDIFYNTLIDQFH